MRGPHREALVLLVDDDARMSALTGDWLERSGLKLDFATCGADALNLAGEQHFDAIILDLELPDMGGITVCRKLRDTSNPATPIIMLTARDDLDWKLRSLDAGADDYLTKPFSPSELIARLVALMRRDRHEVAPELIELEGVRVDLLDGHVTREGRILDVLPTGVAILAALMRAYPRVVTRDALLRAIWGNTLPDSDSLRSHLYQLRRALNTGFATPLVETIPGVGLRFRAPRLHEEILRTDSASDVPAAPRTGRIDDTRRGPLHEVETAAIKI